MPAARPTEAAIAASEATAAKMLDLPRGKFRDLVEQGALPQGRELAPGIVRWRVADLEAILTGDAMGDDFKW